ncbi:MAG: hypothetical protein Q8M92_01870 [Candidatus Subteraquimicrobiales bacterium]|nr:hypothetical protein [Candidatus Subteraquimicrobiales bacterium]
MEGFIVMSDAAVELKRCWKPEAGDRFYVKNDLYLSGDKLTVIKSERKSYTEGIHVLCEGDEYLEDLQLHCVWLASQDQLQRLLKRRFITNSSMMKAFGAFCYQERYGRLIRNYSIEELWLMFYYYEIHDKMWDGHDWVKIDKTNLMGEVWS